MNSQQCRTCGRPLEAPVDPPPAAVFHPALLATAQLHAVRGPSRDTCPRCRAATDDDPLAARRERRGRRRIPQLRLLPGWRG